MYKDRDDKDGRMKFGPVWDYDLGFGNTTWQNGNLTNGWQFEINTTMSITRYFQDTKFVKLFQDRWHELRARTYSNDSILTFFDKLVNQVHLACEQNYEVWPTIDKNIFWEGYYVNNYNDEIETIKNWITARLEWIDANVDNIYYPLKIVSNNQLASLSGNINLSVYPNPFESEVSIRFNLEKESNVRIELFNITGQLKQQISLENVSGSTNFVWKDSKLSSLPNGMYIAKIIVNEIPCESIKIIKK
jgi:hypothetical protein